MEKLIKLDKENKFENYSDLAKKYFILGKYHESKHAIKKALKIQKNAELYDLNLKISDKIKYKKYMKKP